MKQFDLQMTFDLWSGRSKKVDNSHVAMWLPNLVGRTSDQNVVHCWGKWLCRGQLGSPTGQIARECRMATKYVGRKNPWAMTIKGILCWFQRSCVVNQRSNWLEMPYSHQMWLMLLKSGSCLQVLLSGIRSTCKHHRLLSGISHICSLRADDAYRCRCSGCKLK